MGWNPLGNQEKTNFLDKMSLLADNGRSAAIRPFHPSRRLFHNFQFGTNKFCYLHKSSLKFRDTKYTCIYFLSFPPMKISNGQILTQICFKFGSNFCGGGVFVEPVKVKVQ